MNINGLYPRDFNHSSTAGSESASGLTQLLETCGGSLLRLHVLGLIEESYWQPLQAVGEHSSMKNRERLSTLAPPPQPQS